MKTIPVNLIGNEKSMYIIAKQLKFFYTINGEEYYGLIREGKIADGNSTPWFIHWLLKPNGPHVDTGDIHDSLYEEPVLYRCKDEKPYVLSRKECDQIHFYFLRHDTGLLDPTFEASPSLWLRIKCLITFSKAPQTVIKDRKCNMLAARIVYAGLRAGGWMGWLKWRRRERNKRENNL